MTFTGYKFPMDSTSRGVYFATLPGPFLRTVDQHSHFYKRGQPEPMDSHTAQLLQTSPFHDAFLPSEFPVALGVRRPMVVHPTRSILRLERGLCVAHRTVPEVQDDDNHIYRRARRFEICSKTLAVLESSSYRRHFAFMDRAS